MQSCTDDMTATELVMSCESNGVHDGHCVHEGDPGAEPRAAHLPKMRSRRSEKLNANQCATLLGTACKHSSCGTKSMVWRGILLTWRRHCHSTVLSGPCQQARRISKRTSKRQHGSSGTCTGHSYVAGVFPTCSVLSEDLLGIRAGGSVRFG